ncbi:MAG TPA: His/Gly/Thr/Pro-type tRNA ligase C-terminal domain-containing protein, partial [bacterium]|nr:His/Gly/Thr/Pro-type tRNA ligase C-terminal domain-containing protein [bacterium]
HSDDKGLVLPPRLAPVKAVLVPIWKEESEREVMLAKARELTAGWEERITFKIDERDQYRPGYKFNEWEKKGVPIRIEMGPKDVAAGQVVLVRRDTGEKSAVPQENLLARIEALLVEIQQNLYTRARDFREANTFSVDTYEELAEKIENPGGFFWVHWCGSPACEARFQEEHKATIRLVPIDEQKEEGACIVCGGRSGQRVLVAKSY